MRVKLFTFRYSATLGGFDDTLLSDFIRDKEIVAFREHFYSVNEVPHVSCVLTYQDAVVPPEAMASVPTLARQVLATPNGRRDRPDPTVGLAEPERVLFNTLREWRGRKAHEEGVPPYLVFTNRELIGIVQKRPDSPNALASINGIGPGKVKRYAAEILHMVRPQAVEVTA
jgi:superfamily II DNA helicase RecQ